VHIKIAFLLNVTPTRLLHNQHSFYPEDENVWFLPNVSEIHMFLSTVTT